MMTELTSYFTHYIISPYDIKSHLDMYNDLELKVVVLLELLSATNINESSFDNIRCNYEGHDHDDLHYS